MEPNEKVHRPRGKMMVDNFLGGIAWSFGTLIGAAIIIGIAGFIVSQKFDLVPIIGSFISQVVNEAALKNPSLFAR